MINEIIQGYESAAYGMLVRMMVTEHGMAYSPRGPGSRSAHMSRGSRVPPGRSATPTTGQRGTGICGGVAEEVGEMPRAEPATTLSALAGRQILESVLPRKEAWCVRGGADGKGLGNQHLAGGLLYNTGPAPTRHSGRCVRVILVGILFSLGIRHRPAIGAVGASGFLIDLLVLQLLRLEDAPPRRQNGCAITQVTTRGDADP